jgi:hypothetical protein
MFYVILQVFKEFASIIRGKYTEVNLCEAQIGAHPYHGYGDHLALGDFAGCVHEYITQILLYLSCYFLLSGGFHKIFDF